MMPAKCGVDFIRGENWSPLTKTRTGWELWVRKKAQEMSKRDRMKWTGFVAYAEWNDYYRVCFGAMPHNLISGKYI